MKGKERMHKYHEDNVKSLNPDTGIKGHCWK